MNKYEKGILELGIRTSTQKLPGLRHEYEVVWFDSCGEMIEKIKRGIEEYKWEGKGYSSFKQCIPRNNYKDTWTYGQLGTYEKTLEYLEKGEVLDSVMKKANKLYEELTEQPNIQELMARAATFKRKRKFSEEGAELCIDRILAGDPAHWATMTKGKKNSVIKLAVNLVGSSGEDEQRFNNITAVTGVVTDILNRAGFAVEVYACCTSSGSTNLNHYDTISVCLKKAEEALDLKRLYSVGCSGFFRCWIFQVYMNILKGTPSVGLGRVHQIEQPMLDFLELDYVIDSSFDSNNKAQTVKIENLFNTIISSQL